MQKGCPKCFTAIPQATFDYYEAAGRHSARRLPEQRTYDAATNTLRFQGPEGAAGQPGGAWVDATLRFIGLTALGEGGWIGAELDAPAACDMRPPPGGHFEAAADRKIFVRSDAVRGVPG
jgi:hypothetical protein